MNAKSRDSGVVALRRWIGRNVRHHRQRVGLTIKGAAKLAGIHWRHWQKIEASESNATLETLVGLARALDVHVYVLLLPSTCPLHATAPRLCEPPDEGKRCEEEHSVVASQGAVRRAGDADQA